MELTYEYRPIKDDEILGFYHEYDEYGCFSNWYKSPFTLAGKEYSCVEQYMMAQKMLIYKKYDLVEKIMNTDDQMSMKRLGRTPIPHFKEGPWEDISYTIVKRGVKAKFQQNKEIRNILLSTGRKILAECAPNDPNWGISLGMDTEEYKQAWKWRGKNKLGRILMEVREELKTDPEFIDAYDMMPIYEWDMLPGQLMCNPKYYSAVQAYIRTLEPHARQHFTYGWSFSRGEFAMRENMGGGLPIAGFYEMKQEIYDIARACSI